MNRFKKANQADEPQEPAWKPSAKDARALSEKLKDFPRKDVNGLSQSPMKLYLESERVISFGPHGEMLVKNPVRYDREWATYDLAGWLELKDLEQLHQAFPEQKAEYEAERAEAFKGVRELIRSVALRT